jgi:hypothetical protein
MKATTWPVSRRVCVAKEEEAQRNFPCAMVKTPQVSLASGIWAGTAGPLGHYLHSRVRGFYSLCADYAAMTKGIRR